MGVKGMWPLVKPHLHFASVFQLHQIEVKTLFINGGVLMHLDPQPTRYTAYIRHVSIPNVLELEYKGFPQQRRRSGSVESELIRQQSPSARLYAQVPMKKGVGTSVVEFPSGPLFQSPHFKFGLRDVGGLREVNHVVQGSKKSAHYNKIKNTKDSGSDLETNVYYAAQKG